MRLQDKENLERSRKREVGRLRFIGGLRELVLFHRWKIAFLLLYSALWVGGWENRRELFSISFVNGYFAVFLNIAVDVLLILLGILGFIGLIVGIGTPRKRKAVESGLLRIGFANSIGETPLLLAIHKEKPPYSHITIYEFEQNGIPVSFWEARSEKLGVALRCIIIRIEQSKNGKRIVLHTVKARTQLPSALHWRNSYLSSESFVLHLGESLSGKVSVSLSKTPHIVIGGSTGSGKSVLLRLLLMQAVKKGAVVHIADFKGGVDFSPIWHSKCQICVEAEELLELLTELVGELERRKGLFKEAGLPDIDSYNAMGEGSLRRHIFACDEVAELLDKTGKSKEEKAQIEQIEKSLSTIARQGRAFGIHLCLATQRPDANVLPGQIKNNIDFRVCGRADNVLSQIILDSTAAADKIPKDSQGRFITNEGVVFQGYLFDDEDLCD